jgi:hypothetical protein
MTHTKSPLIYLILFHQWIFISETQYRPELCLLLLAPESAMLFISVLLTLAAPEV